MLVKFNTIFQINRYPCIKGDRKYGLNCKEIKSGDEVSVIVDLESVPHTFCVKINGGIQPFCVTRIPNRVKFTLIFTDKNDEWEFISLKELDKGPDLSRIEEKNRFRYE
ncbi:MAG: hypothetical protein EZS28_014810 [Streblomastix strix]|uniref:Uncharacterized protein n=1 Tax=Streblomastix strix TaxID=222440 RepID=A0A5J4W4X9_9EUKA|nr:MAG: hypothetical protein EZS28_014810 [Streblomastix strix]